MFKTIQRIHFIGIGGSGMSGIAEVLLTLGYQVSGSDLKATSVTKRLAQLGARIGYGHRAQNVKDAQVAVISTAVAANNPEVVYARQNNIPVIRRIEMLAELARLKYTIAVAGTHGKTTVTSMIAQVMQQAGMDPTFMIGGKVHHLGTGSKLGKGEFFIAEADESDGSFLKLTPTISIITNIDNDHLDFHKTTARLKKAFTQFANAVPFYGCAIVCADDPGLRKILPQLTRTVITYGFSPHSNYRADNVKCSPQGCNFDVWFGNKNCGSIQLKVSGRHNILNALCAVACALELKAPFKQIALALKEFESVARRLEFKAEKNNAVWMDDYGHHPTEIRATLSALKQKYPERKIVVLFQPHRYSRTRLLLKDFGKAFAQADQVVLLPIYAASEAPIPGVSSDALRKELIKNKAQAELFSNIKSLKAHLTPNSVLLTLGAGDVWKTGEQIFDSK